MEPANISAVDDLNDLGQYLSLLALKWLDGQLDHIEYGNVDLNNTTDNTVPTPTALLKQQPTAAKPQPKQNPVVAAPTRKTTRTQREDNRKRKARDSEFLLLDPQRMSCLIGLLPDLSGTVDTNGEILLLPHQPTTFKTADNHAATGQQYGIHRTSISRKWLQAWNHPNNNQNACTPTTSSNNVVTGGPRGQVFFMDQPTEFIRRTKIRNQSTGEWEREQLNTIQLQRINTQNQQHLANHSNGTPHSNTNGTLSAPIRPPQPTGGAMSLNIGCADSEQMSFRVSLPQPEDVGTLVIGVASATVFPQNPDEGIRIAKNGPMCPSCEGVWYSLLEVRTGRIRDSNMDAMSVVQPCTKIQRPHDVSVIVDRTTKVQYNPATGENCATDMRRGAIGYFLDGKCINIRNIGECPSHVVLHPFINKLPPGCPVDVVFCDMNNLGLRLKPTTHTHH
eukprot:TRINITY_DN76251_c0_g1_i1.p1 TRINITY_DN76251_c0_g1~~TRINITY_DN76251_c0_g1_i1.p1  ORF type:complete len:449 (-),score=24.79 TRINITY_DN76251_c0_g1_i1:53-1399(-)